MRRTPGTPRLAYELVGTEGPPVLLVMGLGMRGRVWRPQVDALRADHRVATFDHRGVGESDPAPGSFTLAELAGDALRVLDALGWSSAHVVGVSMGGMVAQELALAAPERVRSLALIATHAGGAGAWRIPLGGLARFLAVSLGRDDERFGALAALLYPRDFLRSFDREALLARMREHLGGRAPARTRQLQMRAVMRHDTRARLAGLAVPTLVVSCGRDLLVRPARQRELAARIPGARHVHLDEAGHGVIFQCAPVLAGHLRRHVAAHEPEAAAR